MATMALPFEPCSPESVLRAIADRYQLLQALPGSKAHGRGRAGPVYAALEAEIRDLSRRYRLLTGSSSAEGGVA